MYTLMVKYRYESIRSLLDNVAKNVSFIANEITFRNI